MEAEERKRGPKGFILLEPGNIMQILPEDNKSWRTLFYSLPEELVSKRPAYMNLPRCPFDVIRSDDYAELLNTDACRFLSHTRLRRLSTPPLQVCRCCSRVEY